jgi:hypothetical protein
MKKILMVLGCLVAVFLIPTAKVDHAVRAPPEPEDQFASMAYDLGKVISYKSGLRIAIEGRLRWLGIL